MKILIADDDLLSRYPLQKTLERAGYEVLSTGSGKQAAEMLLSVDGPRLALLDWVMPERDGPSICREVRAQSRYPYIYIVLLTSKESKGDIVAGLEAGADDFLSKPYDPEELKARLRSGERILQLQDRLMHEARHDSLTNVPNRAFFLERLDHAIRQASRRPDYKFALLYFDIDRFKIINDSLGHLAGDRLIRETAERLVQSIRRADLASGAGEIGLPARPPGDDTVSRLGGDEFAILLDDIRDPSDAIRVAERIQDRIAEPFVLGQQAVSVSASIGIALSATGYSAAKNMLGDADAAMYRAKSLGRSRYSVCDPAMHASAVTRLKLETDLHQAIEREEFRVHYQPVVSLRDFRILGFEALVRWERPDVGLVLPANFIPVAEETGLILPIGSWVLQEACHQVQAWNRQFPLDSPFTVAVNISAKQFGQLTFVREVKMLLEEYSLDPSTLNLELTESVAMRDPDHTSSILQELKALGVRSSIDDFGTGYSSFSYLRNFPLNILKIARCFISEMESSDKDCEIVRTIIMLGHNLGMQLIAEGVETVNQARALESLGCEYAQGYFFSKPLEPNQVPPILLANTESNRRPSLPLGSRQPAAAH